MAKKKKTLDEWEWSTLVASWRYYEYRQTIASSSFPADIVKRFFTGKYDDESCKRIASQFYDIDHGIRGEDDWMELPSMDAFHWKTFYWFCKAWCNGFNYVSLKIDEKILKNVAIFKNEKTGTIFLLKEYLENPSYPMVVGKECLVS